MSESTKAFEQAGQRAADTVMAVMQEGNGRYEATYRATGAVVGALSVLAIVVGQQPDDSERNASDWNPSSRITNDTILFSALLAAYSVEVLSAEMRGPGISAAVQSCTFSADAVMSALDSFEKLTGRRVDDVINPGMVKAAKTVTNSNDGAVLLSDVVRQHNPKLN